MEEAGLIHRDPDPDDRRAAPAVLTEAGERPWTAPWSGSCGSCGTRGSAGGGPDAPARPRLPLSPGPSLTRRRCRTRRTSCGRSCRRG
ncbi:hypothetical protein V7793_28000 [Streptomyces sp. KLMMK]|uniref:hypothetical protein n=1 Tax=Streptomyces sp. KLMMK TaxID=3109353 RepID=UPI00300AC98B